MNLKATLVKDRANFGAESGSNVNGSYSNYNPFAGTSKKASVGIIIAYHVAHSSMSNTLLYFDSWLLVLTI